VHELLHPIVQRHQDALKQFIDQPEFSSLINAKQMRIYGYMEDESDEAKVHALKECAVRAISMVLTGTTWLEEYSEINVHNGFLAVPDIVAYTKIKYPTEENLEEFLTGAFKYHVNGEK
jgi:phosphopantetheinyl transferase (holo-ACP synthase)